MHQQSIGRHLALLFVLALAVFPARPVVALDSPPPPPAGRLDVPTTRAPNQPAAGQALLYDQTNFPSGSGYISSNNATDNQYDARAADDFVVSSALNSWQITAVEVAGLFFGGTGSPSVSSVNVGFYTDGGGRPGYQVYTANVQPVSGTATSGEFFLPLNPTVYLAANAKYWVSVQAAQSTSWYWYWRERTAQNQNAAQWLNPSGVFVGGCKDWTAIDLCWPGTSGPDLLFRLYGTQSTKVVPRPVFLPLVRR